MSTKERVLLTWNLHKQDEALSIVKQYVEDLRENGQEFMIALQESVDDDEAIRRETGAHVFGNGGILLLSSEPLRECQVHHRFVMSVVSFDHLDIAVFNYHGHSRVEFWTPLEARGGYASEYRWIFEALAGNRHMIVMGDFNAEPKDEEIRHQACFSLHSIDESAGRPTLQSHFNRPRKDMRYIATSYDSGATLYVKGQGALQRKVYDFFAANIEIAPQIHDIGVVTDLAGKRLMDAHGYPTISDHFPVRAKWV